MTSTALKERKGGDRIVALTAYTTPMAALLDPHADLILVGDSVGMVLHGLPDTIGVTLDMMAMHGRAVMRERRARSWPSTFPSALTKRARSGLTTARRAS